MAHGWGGMAALGQSLPRASRGCSCAAPLVLAACCTPARVCISLSFVLAARCPIVCTRLSRRLSAALTALQELLYQSLQTLVTFESVTPAAPAVPAAVPSHPSCPCAAVRAGGLPAASSAGPPPTVPSYVAEAGRVAAGWQGVGGRGQVGLREKWLYFSYTLFLYSCCYVPINQAPTTHARWAARQHNALCALLYTDAGAIVPRPRRCTA
jgi:hypothetical protein